VSSDKSTAAQQACVRRMDGYFICDEFAVIMHRPRELIGSSQEHSKIAFMRSANDLFCDLVETLDRGWTMIEEIGEVKLAAKETNESPDQDVHS
jgi:hypothetical protein